MYKFVPSIIHNPLRFIYICPDIRTCNVNKSLPKNMKNMKKNVKTLPFYSHLHQKKSQNFSHLFMHCRPTPSPPPFSSCPWPHWPFLQRWDVRTASDRSSREASREACRFGTRTDRKNAGWVKNQREQKPSLQIVKKKRLKNGERLHIYNGIWKKYSNKSSSIILHVYFRSSFWMMKLNQPFQCHLL